MLIVNDSGTGASEINIDNSQKPNVDKDAHFKGSFPTDLYRYIIKNLIKDEDYQSLAKLRVSSKTVSNFFKDKYISIFKEVYDIHSQNKPSIQAFMTLQWASKESRDEFFSNEEVKKIVSSLVPQENDTLLHRLITKKNNSDVKFLTSLLGVNFEDGKNQILSKMRHINPDEEQSDEDILTDTHLKVIIRPKSLWDKSRKEISALLNKTFPKPANSSDEDDSEGSASEWS